MHIEFCPPSPKAGQREHVSQTTALALITAGFAKEIPPTTAEKLEAVSLGGSTHAPFVAVPEWRVLKYEPTGQIVVQRRFMSDVLLFDAVPDHTKWNLSKERAATLRDEFATMVAREQAQAEANDRERDTRRSARR